MRHGYPGAEGNEGYPGLQVPDIRPGAIALNKDSHERDIPLRKHKDIRVRSTRISEVGAPPHHARISRYASTRISLCSSWAIRVGNRDIRLKPNGPQASRISDMAELG